MTKFRTEITRHIVKSADGTEEIFEDEKAVKHNTATDPFYMTFLNYVKWLYGIKGVAPMKVLIHMMNIAEFNTGKVVLAAGEKLNMRETLGISEVSLYGAINHLVEQGLIKRTQVVNPDTGEIHEKKGEFLINPELFWKGDLSKRGELIVIFKSVKKEDSYGTEDNQ